LKQAQKKDIEVLMMEDFNHKCANTKGFKLFRNFKQANIYSAIKHFKIKQATWNSIIEIVLWNSNEYKKTEKEKEMVEEKQKAVELARCTSNSYVAKYYSLDLTMLGCWVNKFSQKPPSSSSLKNTRSIDSGHHALFSEEEAQLFDWIMRVCQNGLVVTYSNIKFKMAEILNKKDLENQLFSFQQFVIHLGQKNDYSLEMITNIDETLVYFDMASGLTVNTK
ncbi:38160_t:CDS:2, partial [Gigaspora margarita]